jgi:hypothetical protein
MENNTIKQRGIIYGYLNNEKIIRIYSIDGEYGWIRTDGWSDTMEQGNGIIYIAYYYSKH